MTKIQKSLVQVVAIVATVGLGLGLTSSPTEAKTKTKLVCKTVKGKKKCTRVPVKAKKAKQAAADTTAASADTTAKQ
jgi:hypothetical protein